MTSGVLIEAVTAGKPVVSTGFPHARELLADGAGLLVERQDPAAIAAALRRVFTEPGLAASMAAEASRIAPDLLWPAVADGYRRLADPGDRPGARSSSPREGSRRQLRAPLPAERRRRAVRTRRVHPAPPVEHGYCVDDVARGLLVAARRTGPTGG